MRHGPFMTPEEAALEAFAKILAKKRGGTWSPVRGDRAKELKAELDRRRREKDQPGD